MFAIGAALASGGVALFVARPAAAADPEKPAAVPTLDDLAAGRVRIIDLSYPLNSKAAYWPGDNYKPFDLRTIATLERDGVLSKAFSTPEHLGTHLDAPSHFERDGVSVDRLDPRDLFASGVVIDVTGAVAMSADYRLTKADIERWEAELGEIPRRTIVLLRTGWGRFWNEPMRYQNHDLQGRMHFPGFSAEAVEFLLKERQVRGVGLDTMSVDYGLSRDFVVHHVLAKAGAFGLENVAKLDELPARGFWLSVAPIKIETGTGGPARVFALLPKRAP
ncbi:MAG: cyclase family protein [Pirellulales bacterium]|nr:cyclase family protein [Pirellulales bacterium]